VRIYGYVLAPKGVKLPWAFAALWRLHAGMLALALLLYVQQRPGSIAQAGACDGVMALAVALTAIVKTRLIDRFGVARVLVPQAALLALGYSLLLWGHESDQLALLIGGSALIGFGWAHIGGNMRLIWLRIHARRPRLRAASAALESSLSPTTQTVGPLLVSLLVLAASPTAAFIACFAGGVLSALGFAATPLARQHGRRLSRGLFRLGSIGAAAFRLLAVSALLDVAMGALPVLIVFAAKERGHAAAAGIILALLAITEALSALVIGVSWLRRHWRGAMPTACLTVAVACGIAALSPETLVLLAVLMLVIGVSQGPLGAGVMHALGELVAPEKANEALSYNQTLVNLGGAVGAAAAGGLASRSGPALAWLAAAAIMMLATLIALFLWRRLRAI
jgi:predicted MFS family arabinose efflux permease